MRLAIFVLASAVAWAGQFSTALGDAYPYQVYAMTTDAAGNTYVAGIRALGYGDQPFTPPLSGAKSILTFSSITP